MSPTKLLYKAVSHLSANCHTTEIKQKSDDITEAEQKVLDHILCIKFRAWLFKAANELVKRSTP